VRLVKKYESGMVMNPITIHPDETLADALALMKRHGISGIPWWSAVPTGQGQAGGHPHQPGRALRHNPGQPVLELIPRTGSSRSGRA
jgi:IMP dehydrogenase